MNTRRSVDNTIAVINGPVFPVQLHFHLLDNSERMRPFVVTEDLQYKNAFTRKSIVCFFCSRSRNKRVVNQHGSNTRLHGKVLNLY